MSPDADAVHRNDHPARDVGGSRHRETGDHIHVGSVNFACDWRNAIRGSTALARRAATRRSRSLLPRHQAPFARVVADL